MKTQTLPSLLSPLCLGLALLTGCGTDGPAVVPVHGKVTRGGQPVANLHLNFRPDSGRPSWAETDANGEFEVEYSREQKGAKVGHHKVWVQYTGGRPADPGQEAEMVLKRPKGPPKEIQAIEEKYGTPDKSPLTVDVTTSGQFLDIKLD
jgi:hypothetical protein